jgi:hypothetical protein
MKKTFVLFCLLVLWRCGWAQDPGFFPLWNTYSATNDVILRDQMYGNLLRDKPAAGVVRNKATTGLAVTTLSGNPARSATANTISKLAQAYPASAQPQVERVFSELYVGYGKIEQQFGIPRHDVAGSVAAFLAGSYMAYRNVDFPDEHFKPLVAQMRQIIGSNPDFAKASNAEKQEMYEQMAILGMFMANTQMALKEKPNAQIAANMRQAAKGYLEQFLKTDADRVQITAQGLVLK